MINKFHIIELDSIDSTNNYLSKLNNTTKLSNGTVILAYNQTNGRGQRGNTWSTIPHQNLTFSLFYTPDDLKIDHVFLISMATANAIHQYLASKQLQSTIKWPNDILVDKKKIAGILIENTIQQTNIHSSIIGIGLNINQTEFEEGIKATSLLIEKEESSIIRIELLQLLEFLKEEFYF